MHPIEDGFGLTFDCLNVLLIDSLITITLLVSWHTRQVDYYLTITIMNCLRMWSPPFSGSVLS